MNRPLYVKSLALRNTLVEKLNSHINPNDPLKLSKVDALLLQLGSEHVDDLLKMVGRGFPGEDAISIAVCEMLFEITEQLQFRCDDIDTRFSDLSFELAGHMKQFENQVSA